MPSPTLSRRLVLLGGGGLSLTGLASARAQSDDLMSLTWDEARAKALWSQSGGPQFTLIDDQAMTTSEGKSPPAHTPLTPEERVEIGKTLTAACLFYRARGMAPPMLPILNGRFHLFFVDDLGDVNGQTADAFGTRPGWITDQPSVPMGVHLMINATNYFHPDAEHPWGPRITIAHEMLHAIDRRMVANDGWKPIGKWWREGNVEATGQHAYGALGYRPLEALKPGDRLHAQNVGMRPYDYPLTLLGVPAYRPSWVRKGAAIGEGEGKAAATFFDRNATYFTGSFWRYLLKEEAPAVVPSKFASVPLPGDFELMPALRSYVVTPSDRKKAAGNPHMDPGVPLLDRFLRERHPTWKPTGLYRAFPAFIAHFVEWPDQVIKSRQGLFAHASWMDVLFMEGAPKKDISGDQDIRMELEILPLAAKAVRFVIPKAPIGENYPPITISVSILDDHGQDNAIDNIHVGLRGQCLANHLSQPGRYSKGRVRRWSGIKATPLKRRAVNNETVLTLINVAPEPWKTKPVKVRLTITLQIASTAGQASYHPLPIETDKGKINLPSSTAPKPANDVPTIQVARDVEKTSAVFMSDADIVRMMTANLDANQLMSVERETDEPPALDTQAQSQKLMAGLSSGTLRPLSVELELPRVEPDYVGPVSGAKVIAEWSEPKYAAYAQYGVSQAVRIETDAVQVQITSSSEGSILGRFTADFDAGKDNLERIFRGRIEGKFSLGIAIDHAEEDNAVPKDPAALMPTDFFVAAARAGMDGEVLKQALLEAGQQVQSDPEGPSVGGTGGGSGSGGSGAAGGYGSGGSTDCPVTVTRADFEPYFQERFGALPGVSKAQLAEMKASMLESWDLTKIYVCDWKTGG
ncbi:MAG: hypothetical protein GC145_17015 [Caulobacter sp.]|nr:hypothetical protein [Caulobacter sp.]